MIEIPESVTIAAQLKKELGGKTVTQVITGATPHKFAFFYGDQALYNERLAGKCVDDVVSHAGYVEIMAGNMRVQLAENPQIRYVGPNGGAPDRHQLCLRFDDGSALYCTAQMFAVLYVCAQGENDNAYYLVTKQKPSPLSDEFDYAYFRDMARHAMPALSAKAFLATEQRIPGLGNGTLQDILFLSGIHPKTKVAKLREDQWELLFATLKKTLRQMTDAGGRDTEKDIYGAPGGYKTILSAKTWQYACPVCGGSITKQAYLGGAVYFCAACQPEQN